MKFGFFQMTTLMTFLKYTFKICFFTIYDASTLLGLYASLECVCWVFLHWSWNQTGKRKKTDLS